MPRLSFDTPTGPLTVVEEDDAITAVRWEAGGTDETPLLCEAWLQLWSYFAGARRRFDLPLSVAGAPFQQAVCAAMLDVGYGDTTTYGAIAQALGHPAQAVGQACGRNPIPVIIPCHRVLGADNLGGFSGGTGIEAKVWLLRHEGGAGLLI